MNDNPWLRRGLTVLIWAAAVTFVQLDLMIIGLWLDRLGLIRFQRVFGWPF